MESLLMQSDAGRKRVERAHERSAEFMPETYEQHSKKLRGGESANDGAESSSPKIDPNDRAENQSVVETPRLPSDVVAPVPGATIELLVDQWSGS